MNERITETLAKSSLTEEDIAFLMSNLHALPVSALERLGLAPARKEPVKAEASKEVSEATTTVKPRRKRLTK